MEKNCENELVYSTDKETMRQIIRKSKDTPEKVSGDSVVEDIKKAIIAEDKAVEDEINLKKMLAEGEYYRDEESSLLREIKDLEQKIADLDSGRDLKMSRAELVQKIEEKQQQLEKVIGDIRQLNER